MAFAHTVPQASEGMRQSPRGEREMVPTLGAVRHAAALELLTEETADEDAEAAADEVRLKFAAEGMFRQVQDFIRFRTVFNEVEEEKSRAGRKAQAHLPFSVQWCRRPTAAGVPG